MVIKFSDDRGRIITTKAKLKVAWECYAQRLKVAPYSVSRPGKVRKNLDLAYPEGVEATPYI